MTPRTVTTAEKDRPPTLFVDLTTVKKLKRIIIAILGMTVLTLGVALVVLPGPAFLVIPAGLAILAVEFAWARRWLRTAKGLTKRSGLGIRNWLKRAVGVRAAKVTGRTKATADSTSPGNCWSHRHSIPAALDKSATIEAQDISRFEGEGGLEDRLARSSEFATTRESDFRIS